MKKNILKASAAALAALLFLPGCNREASISEMNDGVRSESLSLWFEGTSNPDTRVSVDGTTGVGTWSVGDRIAIWVQTNDAYVGMYQIKAIEDIEVGNESTGHVMISMAADQNRANFAIYPHTAAVEDHHTADDLYVTYPSEYDYSHVAAADLENYSPTPMVAINNPINHIDPSATIPPLEFYHVGGVIRVTVNNVPLAARRLRFTFPEGMKFSGTFKVNVGTTGTDAEKMQAATLTDVSGETYGNVITIVLPVDFSAGDLTMNIPLPYGTYEATDRSYKIEALTDNYAFMAATDYVNWKVLRRAEGKISLSLPLETLGLIRGIYVARGDLMRPNTSTVNPNDMSIAHDQMEAISVSGTDLWRLARTYFFNWNDLGKIMTGNSAFDGSSSFGSSTIVIDGVTYRVPTINDWYMILSVPRAGSMVNGSDGKRYSFVTVSLSGTEYESIRSQIAGLLIYPDGGIYTSSISNFNNGNRSTISYSEYRRLCDGDNGCVFLPAAGYCFGDDSRMWTQIGIVGRYHTPTWASSTQDNTFYFTDTSYSLTTNGDKVAHQLVRLVRVQ